MVRRSLLVVGALVVAAACTTATPESPVIEASASTLAPTTAVPVATTALPPATTTTTPPPPQRHVVEQPWVPFATVGGVVLQHPAARVERVGFHQSNHEGAQPLEVLATAANPVTLESRDRLTDGRTAADVVVDPGAEIRSPATGTVKRAGRYTLYCEYSDDFLVIEPDGHPGWEVKLLHISGVQVVAGDRVTAGETVVAPRATQLPFESQVDEARTVDPAWPHVHIEVVDPSIRNIPSPGGGC